MSRCLTTRRWRLADGADPAPVLVLAPIGRDAAAIERVLTHDGVASLTVSDASAVCTRLTDETPLLVVTEEGLANGGAEALAAYLDDQPAWSDLPIILLAAGGPRRGTAARWLMFERLGNVTVLDRPLHVGALQSAVRAAMRGRKRQHLTRGHMRDLQVARDTLEDRVAERTRELQDETAERRRAEAALLRAQRLEAVGQLTGGVAHDFNNLLQVVSAGVTMLERYGDQPARRTAVIEAMRQASDRGGRLTQQLLAFARRQPLAPVPTNVSSLVEDMQALLRGSLRGDLNLHLRFGPDLWLVETDATQLEVALLNLVVNARDATPVGGDVTILAENLELTPSMPPGNLDGDFVRIAVTDTGSGMDEDTLSRVFEPFFTTKAPGRGTGLGLSQVYGFAKQSGGGVHVQSAPGEGTTVSIFLPRSAGAQAHKPEWEPGETKHAGGLVLVVEDEPQVAELACAMLEGFGYRCEHAADADAALRLDLDRYVAVFSDVVMPGKLDGVALAAELRRRRPDLPVLLATGFAGAPERLAQCGCPVLKKPYSESDLSEAIAKVIIDSRARREAD